jgi:hypothetical protein
MANSASAPAAYIWGGRMTGARQSAPRPQGFYKFTWQVDIQLTQGMNLDDPALDTAFPLVIDQVLAQFLVYPADAVVPWTDPVTGFQTQFLNVGEKWSVDYTRIRANASGQGFALFAADMVMTVEETANFLPGSYYNPNNPGVDP